jgi:two-component system, NtrC family, nitrogen regulation sensor histidine kinase GlnL
MVQQPHNHSDRGHANGARGVPMADTDATALINAIVDPVLEVGRDGRVRFANLAAEQFFDTGAATLRKRTLKELLPDDSPIVSLVEQVLATGHMVSEFGVSIETPRVGSHIANLSVAALAENDDAVVITLHVQSRAHAIDRQLVHRNAARSVTAMAALLAHEVKNPLSGIRGAAQLLDDNLSPEDRRLTQLIRDEADRIVGLVDRMEVFADQRPLERAPVNIHQVLEHVRQIAEAGFARRIRIREVYDPSLPPVYGNRDQLIQVFLNLIKNAADAVPEADGEITLSTAYRHGMRLALPGGESRVQLPIAVEVRDNGEGVPEDLRAHLFDPFITTKANGSGLGLALVAKIIGDHRGVVELDSVPRRTVFRVLLPMAERVAEPMTERTAEWVK